MDELQQNLHKFETAANHLVRVAGTIDPHDPEPNAVRIALAESKRGRRELTLVMRALARLRDQLQP